MRSLYLTKRQDKPAISEPKEVLNWPSVPLASGQISGVAIDQEGNPVIFHRGPVIWNGE